MNNELKMKLESNEFSAMFELVIDICMKYSGQLYLSENFEKLFSPYILCRYISMRPSLIGYANILNQVNSTSKLSKKQFYIFAYNLIPKQTNSFIKYIKKKEKKDNAPSIINNKNDANDTKMNLFDL
jgi:hypothetical protein